MATDRNLERCALLAREAYRTTDTPAAMRQRIELLSALGLTTRAQWTSNSVSAFAAGDDDTLVVAFRGTADWKDALIDADLRLTPFKWRLGGTAPVHGGFLRAWLEVRGWALALPLGGRQLVLCGHSLGGAIATLAAVDMTDMPVDVYSYGCPRVGTAGFADGYHARDILSQRIIHNCDIVPRLPLAPYRHVEGSIELSSIGTVLPPPPGWVARIEDDARQAVADIDGTAERDHHTDTYVTACTLYAASKESSCV